MKMLRHSICLLCLIVSSCASYSSRVVTMNGYLQVENGETREQIIESFGQPQSIELRDDGTEVFSYIERLNINGRVVESRNYYFFIKDGKVVGKLANVVNSPPRVDPNQI